MARISTLANSVYNMHITLQQAQILKARILFYKKMFIVFLQKLITKKLPSLLHQHSDISFKSPLIPPLFSSGINPRFSTLRRELVASLSGIGGGLRGFGTGIWN